MFGKTLRRTRVKSIFVYALFVVKDFNCSALWPFLIRRFVNAILSLLLFMWPSKILMTILSFSDIFALGCLCQF